MSTLSISAHWTALSRHWLILRRVRDGTTAPTQQSPPFKLWDIKQFCSPANAQLQDVSSNPASITVARIQVICGRSHASLKPSSGSSYRASPSQRRVNRATCQLSVDPGR